MLVSQGNHRPVDQEEKEGADIDGIDFARCQLLRCRRTGWRGQRQGLNAVNDELLVLRFRFRGWYGSC